MSYLNVTISSLSDNEFMSLANCLYSVFGGPNEKAHSPKKFLEHLAIVLLDLCVYDGYANSSAFFQVSCDIQ